ncbi:hypothetical protein A3H09_01265 [Candidatus Falkowbacteria bacterium RIFCSPLOWO2_12_FULL_45_13]|uniref:PKD domain-containing protein n=1 Tax=Candidatus Falkowbacteria bacterium RIFCSPLOWO2_12_FULL_45_13 TaxID=1797991 RepID=A0A1F5SZF3_9BACT|nr:MAG: hypothetical protein A3H09_01265 [Candidatus Falkowbacteria bacterium RIFCSPLOWO2_12_FULL_45_13]
MKDYFKPKTWLITILTWVIALGLSSAVVYYEFYSKQNIKKASATVGDNVGGWAWNEKLGWISFNSTDCDKNSNGYVDTNIITNGCNGSDDSSTPVQNYGVKIDLTTGDFSGYAWSSSAGWISFNRRTCAGESDTGAYCTTNSDCSSKSCRLDGPGAAGAPLSAPFDLPASLKYNAIYDFSAKTVTGWAKILTSGDNGWISFNRKTCMGGSDAGEYCVVNGDCSSNNCSLSGPGGYPLTIDPVSGEFSGWAWNAGSLSGEGIGWISFNCLNESPACSGTNYKVVANINRPPTVSGLTAPNWNYVQASANALRANLQFDFIDPDTGSSGSAYQVIVTKADNTLVLDTGKCTGYNTPTANCKFDNSICLANGATGCINAGNCTCQYPLAGELSYGKGYKWSVKVWDNFDAASVLTAYATNPDTDNDDGVVPTFTTYKHEFPAPGASYFPSIPSRGEEVKLMGAGSRRFFSGAPDTPVDCQDDTCDWLWTAPDAVIADTTASSTTIIFNNAGINTVTLRVTDNSDTGDTSYYSAISIPVNVNAKLPKWKEVKPE